MRGIGFGLERIGVLALAYPRIFTLLLALITAICATYLPSVKFNGDVTAVIPRTSQAFVEFEQQKRPFRQIKLGIIVKRPHNQRVQQLNPSYRQPVLDDRHHRL